MTMTKIKNLSPFGEAALELDSQFMELERLSGKIERLEIETDAGLDRGRELLAEFGECGQKIGDGVQSMAKALEEARARAEKAAEVVSQRAAQIQQRHEETQRLLERFQSLGEMVRKVTTAVGQLKKPNGGELSVDEKELLVKHLPELDSQMGMLMDEAFKLKAEAHQARMKILERNADSLGQTLQSARRRLSSVVDRPA